MKSRKKNYVIVALCTLLVFMGLGYAALSTSLVISGTSTITSSWDVEITSIESTLNGSATNTKEPYHESTKAIFYTGLISPGDSATYTITVSNKGTIDAKLDSITTQDISSEAISFGISGINQGDVIAAGKSQSFVVTVAYKSSVTSQPKETTGSYSISLNYVQK